MNARNPTRRLIETFLEAIASERAASRNTIEAYRRDLEDYSAFLGSRGADPLTASSDDARGFLKHRATAGLKPSSLARQLSSVRQFHKHLYLEGRRADDPTMAIEGPRRGRPLPKVLGVAEVDKLLAVAREGLEAEGRTASERLKTARLSCLIELLYASGLRVSELIGLPKSAARAREPLIAIRGKGGKERLVPATAEMMAELSAYRRERGLPALPSQGEDTPLVLPIGQSLKPLTRAALHRIVKKVFSGAADALRARGETHAPRADQLEQASAHWLRHSAGSHMADQQVDLRLVRDNLGHASLTTTSQYLHVDDDRRHRETDEKHRIDW